MIMMSFPTTLSVQCCIRSNGRVGTDGDDEALQFVELRLGQSSHLVAVATPSHSHQILQQTSPTLISDALFPFPLRELEDPTSLSHYFILRFLSSFNLSPADCETIFHRIASFALQLAAGNLNLDFHITVDVDFVYTHWVDLDPVLPQDQDQEVRKGAPASVIQLVMREKFDGIEIGDQCCSICYENLFQMEKEEVSRIRCGHMYHKCCILKWLNINNSCPLCRRELQE